MAVATTTALLIGAGIAAGSSVGAAKMASGAAKGAAETQAESADKALAVNERIYQQQRADTLPMLNRANQAGNTLSGLMGLPTGPLAGPTGVPNNIGPPPGAIPDQYGPGFGLLKPGVTPEQARDPNFVYQGADPGAMGPSGGTGGRFGQVTALRDSAPSLLGGAVGGLLGGGNPNNPVAGAFNRSGYATMQSPDGKETQRVPANQVAHFEQMGARRIG